MSRADLQRQIDDLSVLLDVSREIGATLELDPLLRRIEQAALRVLDCERASVFVYDRSREELYSKVATGTGEIRFSVSLGIAGEAARTRQIINVPDAYADPRFNRDIDKVTGFRTRNLLTFAMTGYDGQVVGVLQVLNKRGGPFSPANEAAAATLSSLTGVALQRQLLLQEYEQKRKLQRDLALARQIQQSLLPRHDPRVEGFDIAGWNRPADDTGGDCYDFLELTGDRLGILIADATGHGIGPALIVSECRAFLRALSATCDDLETIVYRTNELLCHDLDGGRFVTTFFGVLDPAAATLRYVSAGQGPLLHYVRRDDACRRLGATTLPLGIVTDIDPGLAPPLALDRGDVFALVTDGFFEWINEGEEPFGIDRICALIRQNRDQTAADLIARLHEAVTHFGRGTAQSDDLTAVIVKRL